MATPPTDGRPIVIVVAGESKKGKSTALNNIFGSDFQVSYSQAAATNDVSVREVRLNGRAYILVDTPGFGAGNNRPVKNKLSNAIRGLDFTLLYCMPITPGNTVGESTRSIMINIQDCLHDRIWEKSILLLTHSDDAMRHFIENNPTNSEQEYKDYVGSQAQAFQEQIQSISSSPPDVNTIFDYRDDNVRRNAGFPGIVAVPVRNQLDTAVGGEEGAFNRTPDIIPGIAATESWRDVALIEINNKIAPFTGDLNRRNFKSVVTTVGSTIAGGAAGAGAGAGIGIGVGVVGGPIGMAVGAGVGGPVGAVVGLASGLGLGALASYLRWIRTDTDRKIRDLRNKIPRTH